MAACVCVVFSFLCRLPQGAGVGCAAGTVVCTVWETMLSQPPPQVFRVTSAKLE